MLKSTDLLPELIASMKAQQKEFRKEELIRLITDTVCRALIVDAKYITVEWKSETLTDARRIIFHILRNQLKMSYVEIARLFNRDHSTVIYSLRVYENLVRSKDAKFIKKILTVTQEMEGLCV